MSLALLQNDLKTQTCGECGIVFAAPAAFWEDRHRHHNKNFYCPNGHARVFLGETEAEKYKRLYEAEKAEKERKDRQLAAAQRQAKKIKNRIANGVCPCCHRTFSNLQRHMGTKHPDFKTQEIIP